jgi:flagellin-like protein
MLDAMIIMAQNRLVKIAENFRSEERGASDIVAVIVLIVVVIAVAAIFRKQLSTATNTVFTKLNNWIKTN